MSPCPRNDRNKGLPPRWRKKYQTYYYRVPPGQEHAWDGKKEFRLGKTLSEAYKTFASRLEAHEDSLVTMSQLAVWYESTVVPEKAPATQRSNKISLSYIKKVFESAKIQEVESSDIYKFRKVVATQKSKKQANLALEVLSHMFTKAIEEGVRSGHPMTNKQVVKFSLEPRKRYVSNEELAEALTVAPPLFRVYIPLKLALGQRKADMLNLSFENITRDGVLIRQSKTGREIFFPFLDPETGKNTGLEALVNSAIKQCHPGYPEELRHPTNVFCTRNGNSYYCNETSSSTAFDSMWQRFMKKAIKVTELNERFTEHDLRAKTASDAGGDESARKLMGHTTLSTTRRVYRRKADIVIPEAVPNLLR